MRAIEYFELAARATPDRVAVVHGGATYTYRQLQCLVNRIASALVTSGLSPGDRVAVLSPNHPMLLACEYAIMKARCVWVPINYRNLPTDTVKQLGAYGVTQMFYHDSLISHVASVRAANTCVEKFVAFNDSSTEHHGLDNWLKDNAQDIDIPYGTDDEPIAILTTGGTTGVPKGAVHTNRSWHTNINNYEATFSYERHPIHLVVAPLTHAAGVFHWTLVPHSATHVISPSAEPEVILALIEKHKVSVVFLPPTIVYMLLSHPKLNDYDYSSLEHFVFGAAPMSVDKLREACRVFGPVMEQIYGSTETLIMNAHMPREQITEGVNDVSHEQRLRSVGRPGPLTEIAIALADGSRASVGVSGEILVRGDSVSPGYFNDPERTAQSRVNGWFRTGDIGYLDDCGYLYLVDRKNDMIISGGFNIYPAEIESVVLGYPSVLDCAVVGIPHEKWGEAVLVALEVKDPSAFDEDTFIQFCKARLGSIRTPKYVKIVKSLPRSSVGKVLRRAVRDEYVKS
jgi:acyl-CoA synthetase (AMP-forming)/AMP-acid ligase II